MQMDGPEMEIDGAEKRAVHVDDGDLEFRHVLFEQFLIGCALYCLRGNAFCNLTFLKQKYTNFLTTKNTITII